MQNDDILKQNFSHSYLEIGWSGLLQILYAELPTKEESLQEICFNSSKDLRTK